MVYHKTFEGEYGLSPGLSLDPEFELVSTLAEMVAYSPNGDNQFEEATAAWRPEPETRPVSSGR
jgi:hypothetical protein